MAAPISTLLEAFAQIEDPRKPRRVRHPHASILALTFLGLLCRQTDMAGLQRWAGDHWRTLKTPLGFTRKKAPHATTIRRVIARFSLSQFRAAFAAWLAKLPQVAADLTVAVDGKTSKQGYDADGEPVHMLNVFAHDLNICLAQFPVVAGKPTEPQVLRAGLVELVEHDPSIRLFTGDALFTQRPLAGEILAADRDFLLAVKDNQPNLLEAIMTSLGDVTSRVPDASRVEKKGRTSSLDSSGSRKGRKSATSPRRLHSPASS